jgi:cytochrome c oxidase subunit 2
MYSLAWYKPYNRSRYLAVLLCTLLCSACAAQQPQQRLDSIVIEVTGDEFNWYFRYPGPDGVLGTSDDQHSVQNVFLPDNSRVNLKLKSNDYVYSFALPELGLVEIAVPGLSFELLFTTGDEQTLQLMGDQFCGFAHETLIGKVYVRNQDDGYYGW